MTGFRQLPVVVDDDWKDRGLCREIDPELFFPEKGGSTREAKKICESCEVRPECLDAALANAERFGIWGGLSERERQALLRKQGIELEDAA
jgi:WhiB family redox-sensing transcriptional regulator